MTDTFNPIESTEFIEPNFALAYSALARRVASAEALMAGGLDDRAYSELCRAMEVIEQVEKVHAVLKVSTND
jgi:hypothetical protein